MTMILSDIATRLAAGNLTARDHVETCLAAIASDDGARAFISVNAETARKQANRIDRLRSAGAALPPFAGVTLSVKDLFDVAGEVTMAGSKVLAETPAADRDATVVARLRAAGFIIIGRANMTEFAYSGLGMNPHYGNPRSPYGRDEGEGRIAGGSSSGSAVSIADNMAAATIGTDTGGSTRAPAAMCGIVGMKPTARRMPSHGVYPLSTSFDAAGPMATSVQCCAILDDLMTGGNGHAETPFPVAGLRLALPRGYLFEDLDPEVASAFDAAVDRLSAAGAHITDIRLDHLEELRPANRPKSIVSAEAHEQHRQMMATRRESYDPYVAARLDAGGDISAADFIAMIREREQTAAAVKAVTRPFDALVLPTSPAIPIPIDELQEIDSLMKGSARVLRNTALSNYLDRPTVTLPCHAPGTPPVGLSLMGSRGHDRRLLAIAAGVETVMKA